MRKRFKISWIPLICIIALAAFMRLYRITDIPPGVNRDEASIGYTAYSLITTGKDEYGRAFPLSFQSFGDWKLPVYIYLTIPFVKLFGLGELAVRLPSAIAGIITVMLTYFLVRKLFEDTLKSDTIPLITSLVLALSPWSVHLSRVESESNLAVMLVTLSVLLWLKAVKGESVYYLYSYPLLGLTFWVYHGNHIFSALLFVALLWFSRKTICKNIYAYCGILIFSVLLAVILSQTLFSADKTKIAGISIFGDPSVVHARIELPRTQHPDNGNIIVRLLHNRVTYALETFSQNYLKAFSPEFLFISGGTNHAHNIANFGNLYLIEAPLFYLGILYLLTKRKPVSNTLLLFWLFISPLAASLTKDAPHTNRMFAVYPVIPVLITLGLVWIKEQLKNRRLIILCLLGFSLLYAANIGVYLERYFFEFPLNEASNWGYGNKMLTKILESPQNSGRNVIISRPEFSPYIYQLFYSAYDPGLYQIQAIRYPESPDGIVDVAGFGRFTFRNVDWVRDICLPSTILVDYVDEKSPYIYPASQVIRLPNGIPFLQVYTTDEFGCIIKLIK